MSNTKVIGWTPQLDNALKKLIHNGVPIPANVSKTPVFRQQTKLTAGNAVVQGTISCYNDSNEAIAVYTAVCITGDYFSEDSPDGKESRLNGNCFVKGKAAKDDSLPWGIATCDIAPGGVGDIIIQGIAPALWTGNGGFVSPSGTGLIGSQSGRGEVISPAYKELPGIILLGGGSGAAGEYQFSVINSTTYDEKGNVKELRVSVINGISPEGTNAGVLNGYVVEKKTLDITGGDGEYYIYVVDKTCYALKHKFQSDFFPVLLCATVTVKDGKITSINQQSKVVNPQINVAGSVLGGVTISGTVEYSNHALTAAYRAKATLLRNSLPITMEEKTIPATDEKGGELVAWIKTLTVPYDQEPECGIDFAQNTEAAWKTAMLTYKLSDTEFRVLGFLKNPILPSFTVLLPEE